MATTAAEPHPDVTPPSPLPLTVFGASSSTGQALIELAVGRPLVVAGRRPLTGPPAAALAPPAFLACDLEAPEPSGPAPEGVLVSFAPIWSFAPYLARLASIDPDAVARLRGVVACSSSSVLTKRFAANAFDKDLVQRLRQAEETLTHTCASHGVPLRVLAPTLIYGQTGPVGDRNLSQLRTLLRRLPLLVLPAASGLRQPIHCRQLAAVALHLAERLPHEPPDPAQPVRLALGGDETLPYDTMLRRLQAASPPGDPARRCRLVLLPPRLFQTLAAPLLLLSPKAFEAVQRIGADLAGFTPVHRILDRPPEPFPVAPLVP